MNIPFKNKPSLVLLLFFSTVFVPGCGASYTKIKFCWTSDHHLSPTERILQVEASPEIVAEKIQQWITRAQQGEILKLDKEYDFEIELAPDWEEKYSQAKVIISEEWKSYIENKYRNWTDDQWNQFVHLMQSQIQQTKTDTENFYIKAKLGKREGTTSYRVQTGSSPMTMYNPGFTVYSPSRGGIKSTRIPGYMYTVPMPTYETRYKSIEFYSIIEFIIFSRDRHTWVYTCGVPFEGSSSVKADYGHSIGYKWWPYVTGKEEATLIKECYEYLNSFVEVH